MSLTVKECCYCPKCEEKIFKDDQYFFGKDFDNNKKHWKLEKEDNAKQIISMRQIISLYNIKLQNLKNERQKHDSQNLRSITQIAHCCPRCSKKHIDKDDFFFGDNFVNNIKHWNEERTKIATKILAMEYTISHYSKNLQYLEKNRQIIIGRKPIVNNCDKLQKTWMCQNCVDLDSDFDSDITHPPFFSP